MRKPKVIRAADRGSQLNLQREDQTQCFCSPIAILHGQTGCKAYALAGLKEAGYFYLQIRGYPRFLQMLCNLSGRWVCCAKVDSVAQVVGQHCFNLNRLGERATPVQTPKGFDRTPCGPASTLSRLMAAIRIHVSPDCIPKRARHRDSDKNGQD